MANVCEISLKSVDREPFIHLHRYNLESNMTSMSVKSMLKPLTFPAVEKEETVTDDVEKHVHFPPDVGSVRPTPYLLDGNSKNGIEQSFLGKDCSDELKGHQSVTKDKNKKQSTKKRITEHDDNHFDACDTNKQEHSLLHRKKCKQTVINEITEDGIISEIKDVSKENSLSAQLILSLPSRRVSSDMSFRLVKTLDTGSCEANLKRPKIKKFRQIHDSDLCTLTSPTLHSVQEKEEEYLDPSKENDTMCSKGKSLPQLEWWGSLEDLRTHYRAIPGDGKPEIVSETPLDDEVTPDLIKPSNERRLCASQQRVSEQLDDVCSLATSPEERYRYQPRVSLIDCHKVKISLEDLLSCKACKKEVVNSGLLDLSQGHFRQPFHVSGNFESERFCDLG